MNILVLLLNLDLCDVLRFHQDLLVFRLLGLGQTHLTSMLRAILKYLTTFRTCGTKASGPDSTCGLSVI